MIKNDTQTTPKAVIQSERELVFRQGAWLEERDVSISFDKDWQIRVYCLQKARPIQDSDIQNAFSNPTGTKRLSELAKGKKRVVIIVDDLSRPTPAHRFIPTILSELKEAGVGEESIRMVVAVGGHRPMSDSEIKLKVGESHAESFPIRNHDFASPDLVSMGKIGHGIPMHIDPWVAEADFKIGIGSLIPHDSAGFSGGGKCIVPGVSGFATLLCFHGLFQKRGRGIPTPSASEEDFRHCIDAIVQKVGLDFIVNCVVHENREVVKVVAGDPVHAFQKGAELAREMYSFSLSQKQAASTNLVLVNAYPLDVDPEQTSKALEAAAAFPNAQVVLFNSGLDKFFYRGLHLKFFPGFGKKKKTQSHAVNTKPSGRHAQLKKRIRKSGVLPALLSIKRIYSKFREQQISYDTFIQNREDSESRDNFSFPTEINKKNLVVISPHMDLKGFYKRFPQGVLFRDWKSAFHQLKKLYTQPKVAVLPYSPLQIPVVR